ncbi:MAG: hypothetical protein H6Q93_1605 [Nitrospirae bacterium]|nr:hypothetical protein [Nitrospirota bacterium]MBS1234606.1 hypothetical protein [Nitrospirota bacterium]
MQEEFLREEEKKMRRLRYIVDLTEAVLMQSNLTLRESQELMDQTKKAALVLFPDKESVYDLIYMPRFKRIIEERFTIPGSLSGRN